jgi:hypothetical protein
LNKIPRFRAWDLERKISGEVVEIAYSMGDEDERFLDEAGIPHAARVTLYNPKNKKECGFWGIWIERCMIDTVGNEPEEIDRDTLLQIGRMCQIILGSPPKDMELDALALSVSHHPSIIGK